MTKGPPRLSRRGGKTPQASRSARTGIIAFMCGFVDTIVFVHMGGLFVAHVTGNFVLLGATIAGAPGTGPHSDATLLQIATFPVFILAAFVATLVHDRWPSREARRLLWGVALLVLAAALWSGFGPAADIGASVLLVCAMAALNAAQRLAPRLGPPTTVMTGNTTQAAISLARWVWPADDRERSDNPLRLPTPLVAAFLVGCVLGALSAGWIGLDAVALPGAMLIAVLALLPNPETAEGRIC